MNRTLYLALTLLIVGIVLFGIQATTPAHAQCVDVGNTPGGGDVYVCNSNDGDGVLSTGSDDDITINPGVIVDDSIGCESANALIDTLDGDDTITIDGAIVASFICDEAINAGDGNNIIFVTDSIVFSFFEDAIEGGDNADRIVIRNSIIDGGDDAIDSNDGNDDILVIDSIIFGFFGDGIDSGAGNDTITVISSVVDGADEGAIHSDDGNDTIIVDDSLLLSLDDGIDAGDGNDLIIVNNTTIRALDDGIDGDAGNDTIIIRDSTINAADIAVNADDGDDTVRIEGQSTEINGLIDGGDDFDTLIFAQIVDEVAFPELSRMLDEAKASAGTITINGHTFTWRRFEELLNRLAYRTCASRDGRINDSSNRDCAAPVAIYPGSIVVFGVDPATGNGEIVLSISQEQIDALGIPAHNTLLAEAVHPFTGHPIHVYRLTTGDYQLNTSYWDGKPYIVAWNDSGDLYHHAA